MKNINKIHLTLRTDPRFNRKVVDTKAKWRSLTQI